MHQSVRTGACVLICSLGLSVMVTAQDNSLSAAEKAQGWRLLFDGKTMNGWTPRTDGDIPTPDVPTWTVEDGALAAGTQLSRGYLATTESFSNFDLKVDFWTEGMVDSGVFIRCATEGPIGNKTAVQIQIYDPQPTWPTGSLSQVVKSAKPMVTAGKWNTMEIIADGPHTVIKVNGEATVDTQDPRRTSGPIAVQFAPEVGKTSAGRVKFRNIKIRVLN